MASITAVVSPATVIGHIHGCVVTKVPRVLHIVREGGTTTVIGHPVRTLLQEARVRLVVGSIAFKAASALLLGLLLKFVLDVVDKILE